MPSSALKKLRTVNLAAGGRCGNRLLCNVVPAKARLPSNTEATPVQVGKWNLHTCRFFNDTATTEIYTLSLHDALPIWIRPWFSTQAKIPGTEGATTMLTGFELRPSRCTSIEAAPGLTSGIWKLIWLLEAYSIGAGDPLMKTVAPASEVARGTAVADAPPRARFSPKMLTSAPGAAGPA